MALWSARKRRFEKVHTEDRQAVVPTNTSIEVQAPAMQPPSVDQFWSPRDPSKPSLQFLKQHFYREGRLTEEQALWIIQEGNSNSQI
jgi:serine/threonine-protein phosphatase 2B catalytic subunit